MKLYTYYRSQASYRVRIALNLKGIAREDSFLHLEKGDQFKPEYKTVNPQMVVPTLVDGTTRLFQSLAILEYLEEKYPTPPLLPKDAEARAWVRGFALINVADSHPLIVPRIRNYLTRPGRAAGADARLDPALARRRACGDGDASRRARERQILPWRGGDVRRHLPRHAGRRRRRPSRPTSRPIGGSWRSTTM